MRATIFTKNFTLLVLGQVSSLFGNLILKFALSMYVLEATGSAAIFAGMLAISAIPTILLSPLGGILADRANRRNIMVALDALSGVFVFWAARLVSAGSGMAAIVMLLVALSVLGAFESPTVQACVPSMLTGEAIIQGNALVNQVAAIAALVAPILGSVLYAAFGLKPVMAASVACFFLTAAVEGFIKLEDPPFDTRGGVFSMIRTDVSVSMEFICKKQPGILKLLLLAALVSFFVVGIALIGLPYIVRSVLGLNAEFYGVAESLLGLSAILGSVAAGRLTGKLKTGKLSSVLVALGACLIPAGVVFLLPAAGVTRYAVTLLSFCGVQGAACVFSIFALSLIQQRTPNALIGKVMAYISTITMCAQPLGQALYGLLFDGFADSVYLILLPTGIILCAIGWSSKDFFRNLENE